MSQTRNPPVEIEKRGRTLIARFLSKNPAEGDVDALTRLIDQSAGDSAIAVVVLDLANVQILPSLGLAAIIQISRKCQIRQQKLKLAALSRELRQVLCVTRLDRILELVDTVEGAVE
jgi:anti-anti-sigma factor